MLQETSSKNKKRIIRLLIILTASIVLRYKAIYTKGLANFEHPKIESEIRPNYIEVSVDSVPITVKATLETAYSGTKLVKAYVNQKKEYKLELSVGNQKATVYTDVYGNW